MSYSHPAAGATAAAAPSPAAALDRAYRTIAWRLLPLLMFLWVIAWLDRINVSFAKLTMNADLGFSDVVYGMGAGALYIGYVIFELPSNLLLERIGARKTIARIAIGWGLLSMVTAFVQTPMQFYVVRFLLGAFEAGFYPGVIFYLSQWFPSARRAKVFGIFMSSAALAGFIGAPLTTWIMAAFDGVRSMAGWQWVFLLEGLPAIAGGLAALYLLADRVDAATWLSRETRQAVIADLRLDAELHGAKPAGLLSALRDPRLWIFVAIYFCVIIGNAVPAFWGPTFLREITGSAISSVGWMVSMASLAGASLMIINGFVTDRTRLPALSCIALLVCSATSFSLVPVFTPVNPVLAAVLFCSGMACAYGVLPAFWQMPNMVFAGTAAAASIALINSLGNLGGAIGPSVVGHLRQLSTGTSLALWCVALMELLGIALLIFFHRRIGGDARRRTAASASADAEPRHA